MELQDFINSRASLRLDSRHQKYQDILDSALAKSERNWRTGESKEPQSYFTRVTDVYLVWRQLIDLHRPTIDRIAKNAGLTTERILQSSLLCVAFHDFGKLSSNFQDMLNATSKTAYRSAQRRNYRHEIISLPLIDYFAQKLNEKHGHVLTDGHLEALAVAGHHRFLADDYLFNSERYHQLIRWDDNGIDDAIVASSLFAQVMFTQLGWKLPITKSVRNLRELLSNKSENVPFSRLKAARDACLDDDNHPRFRNVFAVLKGLLMVADWRASSGIEFPEMLNAASGSVVIPTNSLFPFVKRKVEAVGKEFHGFRDFQKRCGEAAGHVLATAPTGSGKTEAAFLWALNQIASGACQKMFFLLPTMVTANSLYDRAKAFFKDTFGHEVGLIHSTADLVRADKNINADEEQDSLTIQGGPLAERHFFHPVTIGTVDQLLNSLFHAGRWPLKTFAAMNAAIVIDEIHAYDPHTAGLISLLLSQISEAGGRFMVMSATMPEDLKAIVRQSLTSKHPLPLHEVSDHELLDSARNNWQVRDVGLSQWLLKYEQCMPSDAVDTTDQVLIPRLSADASELLESKVKNGKRVLIVSNTVRRCQDIAKAVRNHFPNAICFHSKFTFDDRNRLEKLITEDDSTVQILVATQVVEVSLDIDFDLLMTECAPIDALVQRAGRINRARKTEPGNVVVFQAEENSDKIYDYPEGVLQRTWDLLTETNGLLTENRLLELVEAAYQGYDLREDDSFKRVQSKVLTQQSRLSGVLDNPRPYEEDSDLTTRLIDYPQISVIPDIDIFVQAVRSEACTPKDRRRHELKMPLWYVKTVDDMGNPYGRFDDELFVHFCRMEYDPVFGGTFLPAKVRDTEIRDPSNFIF